MRIRFAVFIMAMALTGVSAARAEVRDITLGINGTTAQSALIFDTAPQDVSLDVDGTHITLLLNGMSARARTISAPDPHLVRAVTIAPVIAGLNVRYTLSQPPLEAHANIIGNTVRLNLRFAHDIRAQHAVIGFGPARTASAAPHHAPTKTASAKPAPVKPHHDQHAAPPAAHNTTHEPIPKALLAPVKPAPVGKGLVREASLRAAPGLNAKACASAQAAISADPWALDKLSVYGACLARDGKRDQAREVFERLLTFDPDTMSAYVGLGAIAQDAGDIKAAREYYQQALELGRTDAQAAKVQAMIQSLPKSEPETTH